MLLLISGFATWHGMRDFIIGVSTSPAGQLARAAGRMSFSNDFLVIIVVFALTFLMWLALRETFAQGRRFTDRLITFPLYVFLAIWSIGFGYGFWWSLIAGEEATRTGLSGLQQDARRRRQRGRGAARCGEGRPRRRRHLVRDADGARGNERRLVRHVLGRRSRPALCRARRRARSDHVAARRRAELVDQAGADRHRVAAAERRLSSKATTVAERQQSFNAMATNIRSRARDIAARSNELGKSTATEMRAIAAAVSVAPGQSGFSCYDPTLAQRLTQAAVQADQPATLNLREAAFNEGPAGVANAIKRLWENIGSYLSSLFGYVSSGGETAGATTHTGQPITGRDMIALLATIGIDLGLLALAILNPPPAGEQAAPHRR